METLISAFLNKKRIVLKCQIIPVLKNLTFRVFSYIVGYLLDPNGEKCVTSPRQVSALHHKDINMSFVTASDGATVCVTEKGDIYLLSDYQCKKIASK